MSEIDNPILDGFEGPEKRLEITFSKSTVHPYKGMRHFSKEQWQEVLDYAKCTIISVMSNDFVDSYVLSESSLFVYKDKIMLKTCGTTTLLRCLDKLEEMAKSIECEFYFVVFSRKNFNFPSKQLAPHTNFESEIEILNKKFDGSGHILGPVIGGGDHHCVYFSRRDIDLSPEELSIHQKEYFLETDEFSNLEILMSELSPSAMENFYRTEKFISAKDTTCSVGLASILPNMTTDEIMFDPCGYSVNGINSVDGSLFTVHVTPEPHCSFVSFETSTRLSVEQRNALIQKVIEIFQPGRFSVVITSSSSVKSMNKPIENFTCRFKTQYEYEEGFHVLVANFASTKILKRPSRVALCL